MDDKTQQSHIWPQIWRGLRSKCPNCGDEKLFASYLKPVDKCAGCGVKWGQVRADLAPAWAAMTISAHITFLIWHIFLFHSTMPNWMLISILSVIAIGVALMALPAMKGLFMTIIWAKRTTDS